MWLVQIITVNKVTMGRDGFRLQKKLERGMVSSNNIRSPVYVLPRSNAWILVYFHTEFQLVRDCCSNLCQCGWHSGQMVSRQERFDKQVIFARCMFSQRSSLYTCLYANFWGSMATVFRELNFCYNSTGTVCFDLRLLGNHFDEVWKRCNHCALRFSWDNYGHSSLFWNKFGKYNCDCLPLLI